MPTQHIPRILEDFEKLFLIALIENVYEAAINHYLLIPTSIADKVIEQDNEIIVRIDNGEEQPPDTKPSNDLERILLSCQAEASVTFIRNRKILRDALLQGIAGIKNRVEKEYNCQVQIFGYGPYLKVDLDSKLLDRTVSLLISL